MRKFVFLIVPATLAATLILIVAGLPISFAQNANSSTSTNVNRSREIGVPRSATPPPAPARELTWDLPADAAKTKNPIEATPESIAKGKELYNEHTKGNCVFCHGETGAGNQANQLVVLRRKPSDLTNKKRMSAMTDGEIFWKITKGIPGIMPAGSRRMPEDEDRWHLVNYVRTLEKDPPK